MCRAFPAHVYYPLGFPNYVRDGRYCLLVITEAVPDLYSSRSMVRAILEGESWADNRECDGHLAGAFPPLVKAALGRRAFQSLFGNEVGDLY